MSEQEPELIRSDNHGDTYDHPAYATIRCGRRQGHASLFGSELNHQHYVTVEICRATKNRSLHEDRIHGHIQGIVEVNLSEHQWASFVSSMNLGSGVPCTITYGPADGTPIERKPDLVEPNKHDLAKKELRQHAKDVVAKTNTVLGKLSAMVTAPGSISKTALRELVRDLDCHLGNLAGNMSFYVDQHQEMMEKNVEAAKSDVEGYVTAMAATLGLEQLRKMAPQLEAGDDDGPVLAIEWGDR